MTRLSCLALIAALVASPALAQQDRTGQRGDARDVASASFTAEDDGGHSPTQATPRRSTRSFTALAGPDGDPLAATAEQWSIWGDIICGGPSLIIYDEDENGDPVGSVITSCLDDD